MTLLADRYELIREIGRGGMGTVWLGHDTVLDRRVAIKQLGMAPGGGTPDLARAEREAHLAARVNHQNVVAVFDLVDHDGQQWLVMEHVGGASLAGLIAEDGALSPDDVGPLLHQVAGALAAAHDHGIVHRDVKPSNILLTPDGTAKLSDFGIARAHADASLTQTGILTGSPAYLSPEVATGRPATAASDVWSLGATIFHALTGMPPYEVGDNVLGAMYRIVHEQPPTLDASSSLEPLVTAMMQHDASARPTMAAVERSVAELVGLPSNDVPPSSAPAPARQPATMHLPLPSAPSTPEPSATTAFRPLGAPADVPTTSPDAARRRPSIPSPRALAVGAAVGVAAIVLVTLLTRGDEPATDAPRAGATSSEQSPGAGDGATTAEQLEGFAADYLVAASNDPEAGFAMLTPEYQDQSGGIAGYESFWGGVSNLDVKDVRGDPDAMTVSYTYDYDYDDRQRTESVTLQLVRSGDSFLISGAT
ncbi:serine/threonine-protein kinase [Aeromicrobium stalagmiti]|uniref:serine/threonine-protein kinase n=1 Tax=Aeromicrobium stalagmiti TaxID=2738988 RepID=UPI001567D444|nr:serine/threonine-protein kinase [Aeromicrobium stalagmiti]NRQ49989.1 protein kinase [Aeromicrobium stalagmiti]